MRYVDAEIVMKAVEDLDNNSTDPSSVASVADALGRATIYEVESGEVVSSTQTGKPLGDETMPPVARLEARLAAACRLIDSIPWYSIWSIRFVAEQKRFLQELKDSRNSLARANRGETGI